MAYPIPNYSRVWVRGRIIDLGKAATEQSKYGIGQAVTFTPSPRVLINAGTKQIIASSAFRVTASDTNGYFAIQLPATNDPDIVPTNFTYRVDEPGTGRTYNILVPIDTPLLNSPGDPLHGQPVIELSDVVPAPGASAGLVQLVLGRGLDSIDVVSGDWVATFSDASTQVIGPAPTGGGSGASMLSELTDVNVTGATAESVSALRKLSAGGYTLVEAITGVPRGYDSVGTNGILHQQNSADGRRWFVTGSSYATVQSVDGLIGFASGATTGNFYAMPDQAAPARVRRVRGSFVFDPSDLTDAGVCFGIFDSTNPIAASIHCAITSSIVRMSTFVAPGISTEVVHTPVGGLVSADGQYRLPRAIPCDGVTRTYVEAIIDDDPLSGTVCYLLITACGETMVLKYGPHPHFAQDLRFPFMQSLTNVSGSPIGRWVRDEWGWDTTVPQPRAAVTDQLTLARVNYSRPQCGAGAVTLRPPSRGRAGARWVVPEQVLTLSAAVTAGATTISTSHPIRPGTRVTVDTGANVEVRDVVSITGSGSAFTVTLSSALTLAHASGASVLLPAVDTLSDGARWLDSRTGQWVSNRLPPEIATCHEATTGLAPFNVVASQVRPPSVVTGWRSARTHKAVATANPIVLYTGSGVVPVEPGQPYAALIGQAAAIGTGRPVYVVMRWQDAAGANIGTSVSGVGVTPPISGQPIQVPAAVGVAPTGAAMASLDWWGDGGFVAGTDGIVGTELCIALAHGPTTGYIAA